MTPFTYARAHDAGDALRLGGTAGAKYLGGGTNLVDLMRETIERPGTLVDVTGLSSEIEERDDGSLLIGGATRNTALAAHRAVRTRYPVLSRAIIHGEPDVYHMYSQKSLTWNGITQQNRNGLLWDKTMNVDGLKTGHTSGAGFNLIASAVDGQRRLIAVVMGADSPKGREQQAAKLLHWGQQNFDTVQVLQKGKKVGSERIWYGDKEQIQLGTDQDFWLALPKSEVPRIKAKYVLDKKDLEAPIAANQRVGEISLYDGDKVVAHWPLVTLESVGKGGVFSRMSDYLHHAL